MSFTGFVNPGFGEFGVDKSGLAPITKFVNTSTTASKTTTPSKQEVTKNKKNIIKRFRYPLKSIDQYDDYLKSESLDYQPPGLNLVDNGSFAQRSSDDVDKEGKYKTIRGSVILPIPQGIVDGNGASWGAGNMDPLQTATLGVAMGVIANGDPAKGGISAMQNVFAKLGAASKTGIGQDLSQTFFASKTAEALLGTGDFQQNLSRKSLEGQEKQNIQQTQEISALRGTVDALRTETATLNNGLTSISNLIQQDSALEKQQNAQEVERERRLLETKIRMGKESQLEQKITNSLASPVQALERKVTNIFGGITEALKILFFGWLTNQGIEALKAASEGNKKKLEEIKDNVLKGIGDVVKIFTVIQKGFGLVIRSVTGLAGRIGGLVLKLAKAPLNAIRAGLQTVPILKNVFPKGPNTRVPSPGGGKGPGLIGGLFSGINSWLNFKNGENVDAIMNAALLLPTPPIVRGLLGLGVLADDIAEVFGGNLFGKNPNHERKAKEIAAEAEKQKKEEKPPSKTAAKVEPAAKAQTSLMGDKNKKDGVEANVSSGSIPESAEIKPTSDSGASPASATTSVSSPVSTAQTPMMSPSSAATTAPATTAQTPMLKQSPVAPSPPSPEMEKNFQKAWDNRNFGLARGRIESAWDNMTIDEQQQAKVWAKSKGYDWTEMKLTEKSPVVPAEVTAAKMQPLPKSTQNVGELPEPKTSVIMAPAAQNQPQQSSASSASPSETNVPLISSSNPDNFYVLYSQLNYNVVV